MWYVVNMFPVCDVLLLSCLQSVNFITLANTKGKSSSGSWKNLLCMQTHKCMIRPHNRMFREVKYSTWKQVKASLYMILLNLQKNTWNVVMSNLICSRMESLNYAGFYFYSTFFNILVVLIPISGTHRSGICLKLCLVVHQYFNIYSWQKTSGTWRNILIFCINGSYIVTWSAHLCHHYTDCKVLYLRPFFHLVSVGNC